MLEEEKLKVQKEHAAYEMEHEKLKKEHAAFERQKQIAETQQAQVIIERNRVSQEKSPCQAEGRNECKSVGIYSSTLN